MRFSWLIALLFLISCSTTVTGRERQEPSLGGSSGDPSVSESCKGQAACSRGEQEQGESCGNCGVHTRTCLAECQWGEWACTNEGECESGSVETESEACETCGLSRGRTRLCEESCDWSEWSAWSACEEAPCTLGEVQTEEVSCGRCGIASRSRTCDGCGFPAFDSFGACQAEGPCAPGDTEEDTVSCGWCGSQPRMRSCGDDCQWGAWVASESCQEEGSCDPNGAPEQVSRSCGNCNSGTQAATRTCSPSCEFEYGQWGACTGASGCSPGSDKAETVGGCGNGTVWLEYTCNTSCQWVQGGNCCTADSNCNCTASGCN